MWSELKEVGGVTNKVTMPKEGVLGVIVPPEVELCAYVNDKVVPIHHIHVKEGDCVYFELKGSHSLPSTVQIQYDGVMHDLNIIPIQTDAPKKSKKEEKEMSKQEDDIKINNIFKQPGGSGMDSGLGSATALLPLAMMNRHDGLGGAGALGAGALGFVAGALLGNRRGGLFGGDNGGGEGVAVQDGIQNTVYNTAVLSKLGTIEGAIPLAAAQTENVILQQTNAITGQNAQLALGMQQGFSSIKDTIVNTSAANLIATNNVNQNVLEQGCQTRAAIQAGVNQIISKIDGNTIAMLQAELAEERGGRRSDGVEVRVTQNVNQVQAQLQAQQQQQQQLASLFGLLNGILSEAQIARATNSNVIVGNTGATTTGAMTASPTNVRA